MLHVDSLMSAPPILATISNLCTNLTSASIFVLGILSSAFGSRATIAIGKAVDAVLLLPESLIFEELFALRGLFKAHAASVSARYPAVVKLLKKRLDSPNDCAENDESDSEKRSKLSSQCD